jgi:hypothetical protein
MPTSSFKKYFQQSVGTANTLVYNPTASGIQSTVIGMSVANRISNAIAISVTFSQGANSASAGSNTVYIVKDAIVPPGSSIITIGGDQKIVLEANDFIEVSSNSAASADVLLSVLELT